MNPSTARHEISMVTDADQAATAVDEILPVYVEVFAEPPYDEGPDEATGFLAYYHRERHVPGFRLALLRDSCGTLAAFAYGLPFPGIPPGGKAFSTPLCRRSSYAKTDAGHS